MTTGRFVTSAAGREYAPSAEVDDRVRAWLLEMQRCVRARDFAGARELFADEVLAFGTRAARAEGADQLERDQWRQIWTRTARFTFDLHRARAIGGDGLSCVAVPWRSLGLRDDGSSFERRGRATIVLADGDERQPPACVHSHFSIAPEPGRA